MDKLNRFLAKFCKNKRKILNPWEKVFLRRQYSNGYAKPKLNILFFGTDHFSVSSLKLLNETKYQSTTIRNVDVVTSFKYPSNEVKKFAEQHNLNCFKWPIAPDLILQQKYDLGIVVSFGHLIPEAIINAFPLGMINVHASLLPKWRGAAPIIYALMNGDTTTGVSIMKIVPKRFDIGDILAQRAIEVPRKMFMPELHSKLASLGAELLCECVENILQSLNEAQPQSTENVSYAPRIHSDVLKIEWQVMSAKEIYNRFRALYTFKCLTTSINNYEVKISEIERVESKVSEATNDSETTAKQPGFIEYNKAENRLRVHCIGGECIFISKLGVKGKKIMTASEFSNGFLNKIPVKDRYFK